VAIEDDHLRRTNDPKWAAYDWIKSLPKGRQIEPSDVYRFFRDNYPDSLEDRTDYEKDARWGINEARENRLIKHVVHGVWRRISAPYEQLVF
jgi:hypothetical protein